MSETFYIKNSAFSDISTGDPVADNAQREANSFIIGPGELNGPAGRERDSDLELYGFGSLKWGEGVNQNLYRMLESFACPAKVTGNFLPGTDDPDTYDPLALNGSFNATTMDETPQDEYDLGIGNGITTPLIGQRWFNTTDKTLYSYITEGSPAGVWQSAMTATGILDMVMYNIINLADPRDAALTLPGGIVYPNDAVNVGWADTRYVNVTGDTMSGNLAVTADVTADSFIATSTAGIQWENGRSRITHNDGGGNSQIRFGHEYDVAEVFTAAGSGAARIRCDIDSEQAPLKIAVASDTGVLDGDTVTWGTELQVAHNALTWGGDNLATVPYVDGKFVPLELDSTINETGNVVLTIKNNDYTYGNGSSAVGGLEIKQDISGYDSYITFNEGGSSFNFGRNGSTNDLFVGGGSFGGSRYKVWHEGNDGPGSGLNADLFDSYNSSSYLKTWDVKKSFIYSPSQIFSRSFPGGVQTNVSDTLNYGTRPSGMYYVLLRFTYWGTCMQDLRWAFGQLGGTFAWAAGADDTDQGYQSTNSGVSEIWVPYWSTTLYSQCYYGHHCGGYADPILRVYRVGWHG